MQIMSNGFIGCKLAKEQILDAYAIINMKDRCT
jgi:hypothetical protein